MRKRSYEFYEVITNLNRTDEEVQYRGNYEDAMRSFLKYAGTVDDQQGNAYLVRVQVLEIAKPSKKETSDGPSETDRETTGVGSGTSQEARDRTGSAEGDGGHQDDQA